MINNIGFYIAIIYLIVLSVIDLLSFNIKKGYIPAVLTTSFIIVEFIINGINAVYGGLLAGLIAMMFVDLDLFKGVADIKVFIACGMTMPNMWYLLIFGLFTSGTAVIYQSLIKWRAKHNRIYEIPFIPAILIAYLGIMLYIII